MDYQQFEYADFTLYQFEGHIQNNFVVAYADSLLLPDGGARPDAHAYEYFIRKILKRDPKTIKLGVVSHMHPDHAGGVQWLRHKFDFPVAAYYTSDQWYRGGAGELQKILDLGLAWYVCLRSQRPKRRLMFPSKLKPDYLLHDGDSLPFFPDWKVVYTPGHTSHDISLFHESEKISYVGDLVLMLRGKCILPFPILSPDMISSSLNAMSTMKPQTLFMAHGGPCESPSEATFEQLSTMIDRELSFTFKILQHLTRFSPQTPPLKKEKLKVL